MTDDSSVSEPPKEADHRTQAFFADLGYAITRWAYLDRILFMLCQWCLGTTDDKTAAVFYRSQQISDHLRLSDSLLTLSVSIKNYAIWKGLMQNVDNDLPPFRNEIAHNPSVSVLSIAGPSTWREEE
jgi:hypothetical protein